MNGCNASANPARPRGTGRIPVPQVPADDPALVPAAQNEQWWAEKHGKRAYYTAQNQKIVFIGDSITQSFEEYPAWNQLLEKYRWKITNLGFSGDQTGHALWRLDNGEFPAGLNPEYVVLLIGTNNQTGPEAIAAGIGRIIELVHRRSPASAIVLFGILPREAGNDEKYLAVNGIIKNYDGCAGVRYIDPLPYFTGERGRLKEELYKPDKLHLSSLGYELWKDMLIGIIGP